MQLRSVLAGVALLAAPSSALAQSVEVASSGLSFPTITEAIGAAIAGDTLIVSGGTYVEDVVIDKDLTIEGAGAGVVTLTGDVASSIVVVNASVDLTISGVTFDGSGRRAIDVLDSSLVEVRSATFFTEIANNGGAISVSSSDLVVSDSTFLGRGGGLKGGAIYASGSGSNTVDITDTTFDMAGVTATSGGAVYAIGAHVTCTDCTITNAAASGDGGAIHAIDGLTLLGGTISSSSAMNGGAVYLTDSTLTIAGTTFTGNTAILDGGAIKLANATTVDIGGAHFCGNGASFGGALEATTTAPASLHNSTFVENTATSGGAVYAAGAGGWTIENLSVLGNDSGSTGALLIDQTVATVYSSLFSENTGYAIHRLGTIEPVVQYSAFYMNSIGDVQGLALDGGELLGVDPRLSSYTNDGDCTNDELWPISFSALIDAGHPDPAHDDPDGTRNDIGAYGGPLADPTRHLTDADGDGVSLMQDCDDTVASTHPFAVEVCNTVDDDCDELADNDAIDAITWYPDEDKDGYGSSAAGLGITQCFTPYDYVADYTDCNDQDPGIHPGADELCNGIDLNCDGDPHRWAIDASTWTFDNDTDGFGSIADAVVACLAPDATYLEIAATDCDDTSALVHPGATDVCNGVDDNCSGGEEDATDAVPYYFDGDADGYGGEGADAEFACPADQPPDTSELATDCDDAQPDVWPGNEEVCDGLDNDCNGDIDDGGTVTTWYPDADGDGYGAEGLSADSFCAPEPTGWIEGQGGDCDDEDPAVFVDAAETCDGADNDCDGKTDDDDDDVQGSEAWLDFDGDGYGAGQATVVCDLTGYATRDGDCDDIDAEIHPDADEVEGNDLDENCDGRVVESGGPGTEPPADEPGGCACSHSSPAAGWMAPLLALALRRRRSR